MSRFPTRFTVADAPEHFDQVLTIIDFEPGSWTPPRTSGGNIYNTVIQGAISTQLAGEPSTEVTHTAGATFVQSAGTYMEIGNAGDGSARVISTTLLPKGAPLAIYSETLTSEPCRYFQDSDRVFDVSVGRRTPTTVRHVWIDVARPAGEFELVHLLLEFEPGGWTPRHGHGGQKLAMVATGAVGHARA